MKEDMKTQIIVHSIFRSNGCAFANVTIIKDADTRTGTYKIERKDDQELPAEDDVIQQVKAIYGIE